MQDKNIRKAIKKFASSLYRKLMPAYFDYLGSKGVKRKIK